MSILLNFTVEEINLISIYGADTIAATIANIDEAMPDILDEDIVTIAESASRKLAALTEPEYAALIFVPADETEAEPDATTEPNEGASFDGANIKGGAYAEVIQESTA